MPRDVYSMLQQARAHRAAIRPDMDAMTQQDLIDMATHADMTVASDPGATNYELLSSASGLRKDAEYFGPQPRVTTRPGASPSNQPSTGAASPSAGGSPNLNLTPSTTTSRN